MRWHLVCLSTHRSKDLGGYKVKYFKNISASVLVFILCSFTLQAAEYRTDEVIVKFKTNGPLSASALSMAGERPMVIAVDNAQKAIKELEASGEVEYVEPNYIIEAEEVPDDWPYSGQWTQLELEEAWDFIALGEPGPQVVIAVIDSGVDLHHPELREILIDGYDFAGNDGSPEDNSGHGTKVCGVIGAVGNNGTGIAGVAWNVDIAVMPVKFMDKNSEGKTTGSLSDAIDGIYFAVDHGAQIINASWGFYDYSRALQDAFSYAQSRGVLIVASAGNKGQNNDRNDHYPSNYPFDNIIAVAAMDTDGSLASFSNYGTKNVDIAAPGVGITTTTVNGGLVAWASGTSFATPFVTGVAALVLSCAPEIDYASLRDILLLSASQVPSAASSAVASGGCVNAYRALVIQEEYDPVTRDALSAGDTTQGSDTSDVVVFGSGGGSASGGGCMIATAQCSSFPITAVLIMISIVLFRVHQRKDLE